MRSRIFYHAETQSGRDANSIVNTPQFEMWKEDVGSDEVEKKSYLSTVDTDLTKPRVSLNYVQVRKLT